MKHSQKSHEEAGFVLVLLLTAVIPLVAMAAAATLTMGGRNERLMNAVRQERALLAAEAGIDEAVYAAQTGTLIDGYPIMRDLGAGVSFEVTPTYLYTDTVDNDGDGDVDAADEDENVYQLIVTGRYRGVERRFAAYLGPTAMLPTPEAASGFQIVPTDIDVYGSAVVVGYDTKLDGSPGNASEDVAGMSIAPPHATSAILSNLDATEQTLVTGVGASPSLVVASAAVDVTALLTAFSTSADMTLSAGTYSSTALPTGVTYCSGNLTLDTGCTGSGVLAVTGILTLRGNARFDGVVITGGELNILGTASVYGASFIGGVEHDIEDAAKMVFSKEGVQIAESVTRQFTKLQGWQEIVRG